MRSKSLLCQVINMCEETLKLGESPLVFLDDIVPGLNIDDRERTRNDRDDRQCFKPRF